MKYILILLLALLTTLSSCEKDDICDAATSTTPRLVIDFYDFNDPSTAKAVIDLTIIAEGMTDGITYQSSTLINGSTVSIPLKTTADQVKYRFILNYGSTTTSLTNEDDIEFNYIRSSLFVSRACGYKTVYELNQLNPYIWTDGATADELWIREIVLETRSITNENETHLEIFH
ncbi:hypothetical protein FFWV33_10335 [Flavobacterium faecale]|uniref:DUF4843 domain-containing protein n=1 Tax=Flavobacterium faecale TaxID=1355330 RepID=A0A2S1LDU8_9FLAO|nr:DUF6452 family protein [Flavobacterium faecale]AWG21898.1 hypothetical protein FFWV33_10335 [Flavobacterium faecale]